MLPLLDVAPVCGGSAGGLVEAVRLWPVANVLHVAEAVDGAVPTPLTLADPEDYCDLWFLPGSAQFTEDEQENEQGIYHKAKLQLGIGRADPAVAVAMRRLRGRPFIAAYLDANGLTRLIGTKAQPLRCPVDYSSGRRATDRNGYELTLSVDALEPAPFYLTLEVDPPDRKVFSSGFTFGFLRTP